MLSKHLSIKRANERTSEPHVIYLVTHHYKRIQVTSMFHSFGTNIVGIMKRVAERTFREKITDCKKNVSKYLEKTQGSNWILFSESWYQNFQNCLHVTAKQDVKDGALPRRFNDYPKNGRYPEIERCSRTNPLVLRSQKVAEQVKQVTNSLISKQ